MKVTALWLYPIKGIRGIPIKKAQLTPQGLQYDRSFMLCRVGKGGELEKIQLARYPQCSLFEQEVITPGDGEPSTIKVRYITPNEPLVPDRPELKEALDVPMEPQLEDLERVDVNLHNSMVSAFKMSQAHNDWFTACFGFDTVLLYIGNARRPVLGTFSPKAQQQAAQAQKSWLSSITSYITGATPDVSEPDWLTFTDCAPFLVATEASLANVNARLQAPVPMVKFRPNIVLDGETAWDEDFWAELSLKGNGKSKLALTKLCNRCTSVNVDYATGRTAQGDEGTVLKKLMADRRVDPGNKYSPTFGRYGFLAGDGGDEDLVLEVGDEVAVTARSEERPMWDWPMKDPKYARFYGDS